MLTNLTKECKRFKYLFSLSLYICHFVKLATCIYEKQFGIICNTLKIIKSRSHIIFGFDFLILTLPNNSTEKSLEAS